METLESQQSLPNTNGSLSIQVPDQTKRGGWITFPFFIVTTAGSILSAGGIFANLIVYLIQKFNVKSIEATQIANIINGCTNLVPVAGAIISDSYFGCFIVVAVSSFISLMGMILLTLTATVHSLRPSSCPIGSDSCIAPSTAQFAVLYTSIALLAIGLGGRYTTVTMGANQFHNLKEQDTFFNWCIFTTYAASVAASVGIVYIEDNVSWGLGFGICTVVNAISIVVFVSGRRYYRHLMPDGSPFTCLARVIIAAIRKRELSVSYETEKYYYERQGTANLSPPSSSLSFLNRAALKCEGELNLDGSVGKPWKLSAVEHVEEFKTLIKIFPLWSASIFLSTSIGVQISLSVLQALSMDRRLGPHFSIPAGSFNVFSVLATAVTIPLVDRILNPMWQKLTGRYPTTLQRIGIGHILNIVSMVGFALVESRRLHVVRSHHLEDNPSSVAPISALWLVGPLVIIGVGEALHFPGQVTLYYQEFPTSLRSTATAMVALIVGIGFYLSSAVVELMRKITAWLPDKINKSRLDNVYWTMAVLGSLNYGYFLVCALLYQYKSVNHEDHDSKPSGSLVDDNPKE